MESLKLLKKKKNNNNTIQNNYELEDIQNFLNKEYEKYQSEIYHYLQENNLLPDNISSNCYLNSMYSNITKKDYINQVVNCSKLIPKNMDKNFKDCIEIFGYSIKYFILLLLEINNNDKKHEESDDDYSKRILRLFYQKMFNKIAYNIESNF